MTFTSATPSTTSRTGLYAQVNYLDEQTRAVKFGQNGRKVGRALSNE